MPKKTVLAVLGPTASGKTALGIALAQAFGGEIISCDSMQIYSGFPIGTAQPTPAEQASAVHHLINFVDPCVSFSVTDYVQLAGEKITDCIGRKRLPILVGGTGLYARALLRGYAFEEQSRNEELRAELTRRAEQEGKMALYEQLQALDPAGAAQIHPNNLHRVIRALEYCLTAGEPFSKQAERTPQESSEYRCLMLVPSYRDRQTLYQRIDKRVDHMLTEGLLDEAARLYELCKTTESTPTAAQAIGYKELFPYLAGECSLDEAVETLKRESRRYAKRQITWFTHEPAATPLYLDDFPDFESAVSHAKELCTAFLAERNAENE